APAGTARRTAWCASRWAPSWPPSSRPTWRTARPRPCSRRSRPRGTGCTGPPSPAPCGRGTPTRPPRRAQGRPRPAHAAGRGASRAARDAPSLALVRERREERVLLAEVPGHAVVAVLELRRAPDGRGEAGSDAQRVTGDLHVRAARALHRLEAELGDVRHRQREFLAVLGELDGQLLHAEHLTHEGHEPRRVPARLTAEDLQQRLLLVALRLLVDVYGRVPLDLRHVPGRVDGERDVQTVEAQVVEAPLVHVPRHENRALALGGRAEEDTRTGDLAVAALHIG